VINKALYLVLAVNLNGHRDKSAQDYGIKVLKQVYRFTEDTPFQSPDSRPSKGFVPMLPKEAATYTRLFCSWKIHHLL